MTVLSFLICSGAPCTAWSSVYIVVVLTGPAGGSGQYTGGWRILGRGGLQV